VAHQVLRQRGVESADDSLRRVVEDARQQLDPPLDVPHGAYVIDAAIEGLEARAEEADHFRRARVLLAERYRRRSEFEECLYEALHAYAEMPADVARKLKLLL
jgi:hypothetical protein